MNQNMKKPMRIEGDNRKKRMHAQHSSTASSGLGWPRFIFLLLFSGLVIFESFFLVSQPETFDVMEPQLLQRVMDVQTALPDSSISHSMSRLDFWSDTPPEQTVPLLQVVSHRELFIGCYSFQEYLSPQFHTLLVFPKDVALLLHLDQLVQRATKQQTAGLHLFMTEGWAGSHYARRLGEKFAREELDPRGHKVRYMSSVNCDVHPLPSEHVKYQPFSDMVLQMVRDFDLANRNRKTNPALGRETSRIVNNYNAQGYPVDARGNCTHECDHALPHARRPILAMNTVLFEDVPDMSSLAGFHGPDTMDWWKNGGWERRSHVMQQQKVEVPWLQDESLFFEDHMILFDLEALRKMADVYFAVAPQAFPDENSFLGAAASKFGFTLVRHNDMVMRIDFGHDKVSFDETVDVDAIRRANWHVLGHFRSPRFLAANWERAASMMNVVTDHKPFTPFVYWHCRKDVWFPSKTVWENTTMVSDPSVLPVLESYLAYSGYRRIDDNSAIGKARTLSEKTIFRYVLDGIHAATRLTRYGKDPNAQTRPFLSLLKPGRKKWRRLFIDHTSAGPPTLNRTAVLEIPAQALLSRSMFDACKD